MTNTKSHEELGARIEQLIQEHMAASLRCAQEAVARGFASAASRPVGSPRLPARSSPRQRRVGEELAALGERFYEAVCAKPGETMSVLAADVGASARELHRSVTSLRRAGRVRAVGHRRFTRYFPMNGVSASA
jgi:hypothetical protein